MYPSRWLAELPADAPCDGCEHQQHTHFHVHLFAVQEVNWIVLQIRVGQNPVNVEEQRCSVRSEVQRFPGFATELTTEVGRDHDKSERVKCEGAEYVDPWLLRSVHWIVDVDEQEF